MEELQPDSILTEEQEKNVISEFQTFLDESDSFRQPYEKKWFEYYNLFRSYKEDPDDQDKWMSNLHIPIVSTMIFTIVPMLAADYINPVKSFARVLPNNIQQENDIKKAEISEKVVTSQFRKMKFPQIAIETLAECAIYGSAWQKVMWKKTVKKLNRRIPMELPLLGQLVNIPGRIERREVTLFNGPVVDPIDIFYFYPDSKANNTDNLHRYVHLTYMYPKQFKAMVDSEVFKLNVPLEDIDDFAGKDDFAEMRLANIGLGSGITNMGNESKRYEVAEYYDNGWFHFILNRKYVLRSEYEPFFHGDHNIVLYKYFYSPHELYGIGIPELVADINVASDFLVNSRNDWITLNLKRPFLVDTDRLKDMDDITNMEPLGIIDIVGSGEPIGNAIQPMSIPDISPALYKEEGAQYSYAQNVTGINDYIRGANSPAMNDTATGMSIATKQAMNRMLFHSLSIAAIPMTRVINLMVGMNNQYLDQKERFNISADEYVEAGPDDIISEYDVIPVIDPNKSTKDIYRQQFTNVQQMISSNPVMASMNAWDKVMMKIYELFDIEDAKSYIVPPPQMPSLPGVGGAVPMEQGGGNPPPPFPQEPPPPKPPPFGSEEDMIRMIARSNIGNQDRGTNE